MVKIKALNLRRVTYFVLDEADRLFDLGFGTLTNDPLHYWYRYHFG